ncbi:hypothetical protein MLD38_026863 [Melastoma candidum]|uniref:Uncharacterized protein n=1 Tax=Melastoma candidum TaxID=119954 RepID=A0ACB9P194_9MYRT|nr:hypothetical protein MLD38_026863 [Melastoma candidum]
MDSLRKMSFNSHTRRISSSPTSSIPATPSHEELPILSSRNHDHLVPPEVVVNVSHPVEPSDAIQFWKDLEVRDAEDTKDRDPPPPPPTSHLLGDVSLEMDLEMDGPRGSENVLKVNGNGRSRDLRVSFDQVSLRSDGSGLPDDSCKEREGGEEKGDRKDADDEVVTCTSNVTFQRRSTLLRAKTRSRLMDPPENAERWSGRVPKSGMLGKSGPFRSGMIAKDGDDDDDETFFDEDFPEDLKMSNFNALTLLQWLGLILMVAVLVITLTIPSIKEKYLWELELWKWEVMVWVLICGRLISGWGMRIVVFFVERNFFLRKKVLYFVYGVRRAVQNCLWLSLVLIAWNLLFDKKVESHRHSGTLRYITKVLVCLLVATLLWLAKTLIVKVLASSFHVSTYFDRIQESLFNQYMIETLSGPPLVEIQAIEKEEERMTAELQTLQEAGATVPLELRAAMFSSLRNGKVMNSPVISRSTKLSRVLSRKVDQGITIGHLHKLNTKNISAWKMKRLIKIVKNGVLLTLDEQAVDTTYEDESTNLIRSENEAKVAARKIFQNVAKPGSKYIYMEDLMRFMREEEAWKAMTQFEGDMDRAKISKSNLKNWLVNVFRERRALALTLNDTKTAVNKLHHVVNGVVSVVIVIISLLILGIATSKFLLFLSSQLLLVAFVFGNTCKTVFEAIIFLFIMHPFDVGDRCEVDGVQLIVEEMNILTTVFLRSDNQKVLYPNSTLSTKSIGNFYRSPGMGDSIEFFVHISTPTEIIAIMKQRIVSFIENKKEHWCSSPTFVMKELDDLNRVKIALWLCHKMNHQDMGEKWGRRALLLEEMIKIFRELDLQYRLLPLDINVKSLPPAPTSTRMPPTWSAN